MEDFVAKVYEQRGFRAAVVAVHQAMQQMLDDLPTPKYTADRDAEAEQRLAMERPEALAVVEDLLVAMGAERQYDRYSSYHVCQHGCSQLTTCTYHQAIANAEAFINQHTAQVHDGTVRPGEAQHSGDRSDRG